MEIEIEELKKENLDEFWQIFAKIINNDFPGYSDGVINYFLNKIYTKPNFGHWLTTGWKTVLIAKSTEENKMSADRIAGFAILDKSYGGVCFCRWLGVLAEFRNKGVGKKLVEKWINYAKDYGCHKIEIASQPEAKVFYEKCGLKLEGKRKLSYFGIDQYIFGKVIGEPDDQMMAKE